MGLLRVMIGKRKGVILVSEPFNCQAESLVLRRHTLCNAVFWMESEEGSDDYSGFEQDRSHRRFM